MYIHKEGFKILGGTALAIGAANAILWYAYPEVTDWHYAAGIFSLGVFGLVTQFFRNPSREVLIADDNIVYAPADGKVVVIEEAQENEYFHDRRLQVSIFMSPTNVHVNRNPMGGTVNYFKYHPGRYLVAWHPKSSTENERTTVVYGNGKDEVLMRQVAGLLAKRIFSYVDEGTEVKQGTDMGFIKFGSRVDLYLPLDAKIEVSIGQKVKGNRSIIAKL